MKGLLIFSAEVYKTLVNTALCYMAALKIAITKQQISHVPSKKTVSAILLQAEFL